MARSSNTVEIADATDLRSDDLVALAGTFETPRVSLYLPTHVAGRDVLQDPVRARRLIDVAAAEVDDARTLEGARGLLDDPEFWAHGSAGLGILIDPERTLAIRMPVTVADVVVVGDRFHIKPLLPVVGRSAAMEILALSRHAVRLIWVGGMHVDEVDVPGLPSGMGDALQWDDRERQVQSHAAARVGSGRVAAAFHGQGGGNELQDADLERFLRVVDRALVAHRNSSDIPLIVAGVDEVVAAFRATTRCRHVADAHLAGNPDRVPARELADRARELIPPSGADREERARESFVRQVAATVDSIEQAVIAAAAGQVDSLFVPVDREYWGSYRPGHVSLAEHDERRPGDHDLADVAAGETLRHGGLVFAVPADEIPGGGSAAATLHF